jgi:Fe2+ or Zn2+ uptake regulation protein
MNSYHNTTNQVGDVLEKYNIKATSQDARVFWYFYRFKGTFFPPSEIWVELFNRNVPITSVRRSISNLTKRGLLRKTEVLVRGAYGRPEHLWVLKEDK